MRETWRDKAIRRRKRIKVLELALGRGGYSGRNLFVEYRQLQERLSEVEDLLNRRAIWRAVHQQEARMSHEIAKQHFESFAKGHEKAVHGKKGSEKAKAILVSRAKQLKEIGAAQLAAQQAALVVEQEDWDRGIDEALKADLALLDAD